MLCLSDFELYSRWVPLFCCFNLPLANVHPWPLVPFFLISLKNSELKNHPQLYLSGLSSTLFPKAFLEIAVYA